MSITLNNFIPSDGNPNGIVIAPTGSLFYKTGSRYKINYDGMYDSNWINVYFSPYSKDDVFISNLDINSIPVPETGSYLYEKVSGNGSYGWQLLTTGSTLYTIVPSQTPTVTPTMTSTPTPTITFTPTPTITTTVTPTITISPTRTPAVSMTATHTPTPTPSPS